MASDLKSQIFKIKLQTIFVTQKKTRQNDWTLNTEKKPEQQKKSVSSFQLVTLSWQFKVTLKGIFKPIMKLETLNDYFVSTF